MTVTIASAPSNELLETTRLFINPSVAAPTVAYDGVKGRVLSQSGAQGAWQEITAWPDYAVTPLHSLPDFARQIGVGTIWYKDESARFTLGSFKALGGAYGVFREIQRAVERVTNTFGVTSNALRRGDFKHVVSDITVTCATDGNHGRSVAWGAQLFGCRSVIYLPAAVSYEREKAIAAYGATVIRVNGSYDDAVRRADTDARKNGWRIVSDTSYPGYEDVPVDVMHGYTVMVTEVLDQLPTGALPTHVFVQAGVGGLAASVCAALWQELGPARPIFIVVEPLVADCCLQRVQSNATPRLNDAHATMMACLAAEDISHIVFKTLQAGANAFLAIGDDDAREVMRTMAARTQPIVVGESGSAGLAGLLAASKNTEIRTALDLTPTSRVLVFGTEGATDPEIYRAVVSRSPADVSMGD